MCRGPGDTCCDPPAARAGRGVGPESRRFGLQPGRLHAGAGALARARTPRHRRRDRDDGARTSLSAAFQRSSLASLFQSLPCPAGRRKSSDLAARDAAPALVAARPHLGLDELVWRAATFCRDDFPRRQAEASSPGAASSTAMSQAESPLAIGRFGARYATDSLHGRPHPGADPAAEHANSPVAGADPGDKRVARQRRSDARRCVRRRARRRPRSRLLRDRPAEPRFRLADVRPRPARTGWRGHDRAGATG